MEEYKKTTGKAYPEEVFKCSECGGLFNSKAKKQVKCPSCGSVKCATYKQTTASLPKENEYE